MENKLSISDIKKSPSFDSDSSKNPFVLDIENITSFEQNFSLKAELQKSLFDNL